MVAIILVEPENAGNIGAVARSMANFNLYELYLYRPQADHLSDEALARAKHAQDILRQATIADTIPQFDTLVGTTGVKGSEYNITRIPLTPRALAERVATEEGRYGILLGREGNGLTMDELNMCDLTVTIPAHEEYPILNLAHACAILCYELYQEPPRDSFPMPSRDEKTYAIEKIEGIVDKLDFPTEDKRDSQKKFWRRIITKSAMTRRELYILFGFIKRVRRLIRKSKGDSPHQE